MKIWMAIITVFFLVGCTTPQSGKTPSNMAKAKQSQGEGFLEQGNYTAALTHLLEAKKTLAKDPYLLNSLGLAYMGKKREDLALKEFDKALALKPDYTEALNNKGAAYMRQKQWDLAIDAFSSVLEDILYPTPHFPLSNLGFAYMGKLDFSMAEVYFRKALDTLPWFVTASHGLAQVYLRTHRPDQAIAHLRQGLKKTPNAAILYADMAKALEMKGETEPAKRYWIKVAQLSPARSLLAKEAEARLSSP